MSLGEEDLMMGEVVKARRSGVDVEVKTLLVVRAVCNIMEGNGTLGLEARQLSAHRHRSTRHQRSSQRQDQDQDQDHRLEHVRVSQPISNDVYSHAVMSPKSQQSPTTSASTAQTMLPNYTLLLPYIRYTLSFHSFLRHTARDCISDRRPDKQFPPIP